MSAPARADVAELCFTARALAQSHPMTETSHRYRQACVERERQRQRLPEPADWAGTALLVGYCLRRAEEQRARLSSAGPTGETRPDDGDRSDPSTVAAAPVDPDAASTPPAEANDTNAVDTAPVDAGPANAAPATPNTASVAPTDIDENRVAAMTDTLRTGDAGRVSLLSADVTVAALDRLIATELDKRQEHLREQLDDEAWSELGDYIAWWVIHGYALRSSEFPQP